MQRPSSAPLALVAGTLLGGLCGAILGTLIVRRRGVYFAMVTIAFGQVFYFIAFRWNAVTGGDESHAREWEDARWFPDGKRILYVANPEIAWGTGDIWSVADLLAESPELDHLVAAFLRPPGDPMGLKEKLTWRSSRRPSCRTIASRAATSIGSAPASSSAGTEPFLSSRRAGP